jgi:hypothetical protein
MDKKTRTIMLLIGVVLLVLGVVLLIVNLGKLLIYHWWTLIVLGVAGAGLLYAWSNWKKTNALLSSNVAIPGGISIVLLIVFLVALFSIAGLILWPAIVGLIGFLIILFASGKNPSELVTDVKNQFDGDPTNNTLNLPK